MWTTLKRQLVVLGFLSVVDKFSVDRLVLKEYLIQILSYSSHVIFKTISVWNSVMSWCQDKATLNDLYNGLN